MIIVRCIVMSTSNYIRMTEPMQERVAMVPSGNVREGSSWIAIHSVRSVMRKDILRKLQSWIISNHIVETRNASGNVGTGSLYVNIIIM